MRSNAWANSEIPHFWDRQGRQKDPDSISITQGREYMLLGFVIGPSETEDENERGKKGERKKRERK